MSLFERIREKRINLNEQTFSDRQRSDMKKLLNKNFGTKEISKKTATTEKQLAKDNKKMFDVTGKSAVKDAKKYATGEYPKIGGGTRIGSKSKGSGAETGAKVNLNPTSRKKSKGTTPVKVNITKPIKQSEVSKKAKDFTLKVNKANKNRSEFSQNLKKIKGSETGKPISTGDIGFTAPDRPRKIQKRLTRATKQGTPDPFDVDTSKASKEVAKDFGTKPVKGGLDMGKSTTPRKITKKFVNTKPSDIKLPKSYSKFDRDLQDFKDRNKATMRTEPVKKVSKPDPKVTRQDVGMAPETTPKPKTTNVFKSVRAGKKVTNSKGIGNKYRGQENKAAKDAAIKAQKDAAMGGGKPPKPPTGKGGALGFPEPDPNPRPKRVVTKQTRALQSAQGKFAKSGFGKGVKKNLPQVYKGLKSLGPGGRSLVKKGGLGGVVVAGLLSSPTVRKFAKGALTGAGIGFLAGNKKEAKPKAVLSPEVKIRTKRFSLSPGEKGGFTNVKYPKKS
tara:strand:- start:681 stop:2186 length:1506 start_codon:yes stop_codon:yes gene_type:complete